MVKFSADRLALAVAGQKGMVVHQMDVRTAFLHGEFTSAIYVTPQLGIEKKLKSNQWFKLHKSLHGLKEVPRLLLDKLQNGLYVAGFRTVTADFCISRNGNVWILVHVGDILIFGYSLKVIEECNHNVSEKLDITDLGTLSNFLGVSFLRD